jgi:thioredoxin-like negative regulator of GroEL
MGLEAGVRRRRRSHLLAAAAILIVIPAVGLILGMLPGGGPKIGSVPQEAASSGVTPFGQAFARGIEAMRLGDAHAAAVAFDQARAINPHIAEAHVNLGFAYLAMERSREAATAFDRALTIDPRRINAYYGLGEALDAAGDRRGAMGAMRSFVHLTAKDDPFRRKALSALWEWEAVAKGEAPQQDDASPKAESKAVAAKDAVPRDPPEPAPLPAIAQMPEALTPPEKMISIVNVWASWCGPCRAELPSLQAFAAALDPARYRLVGLNIDSDRDFAREFIRDTGVSFGNFWDGKGAFARERFQVDSYPQTLLLDSSGAVLARIVGARDWPVDAVEATITKILAAGPQKEEPK